MTPHHVAHTDRQRPPDAPEPGRPAASWPINEIMLTSLEARGLSDIEIARRFQVTWRQVAVLREQVR